VGPRAPLLTPPPYFPSSPADAALAHPFFDSVRSQYAFEDPQLQTGPGAFDFSFENAGKELSVSDFRRLVLEESLSFKAERALSRKLREAQALAAGGDERMSSRPSSASALAGVSTTTGKPLY
jgi:hypothetical protein